MSYSIPIILVVSLLGGSPAGPEISTPRLTYGHLGATRPKTGMLPGDVAHVSFDIKNLKADKHGKVAYSVGIVITDAAGKLLFEQKPYKSSAHMFGGNTLPAAARIELPYDSKPGPVNWKVTVTDLGTKQSAELKGQGKILPPDFGLVQVATFADAENRVPRPPMGVVGGQLYLNFGVTGFNRDKTQQPDIKITLRILNEKGQPTTPEPLTGRANHDVAADVRVLPMQFSMSLDNVGRYTLELTAEDVLTGKSASVTLPVRILPAK